MLYIDDKTSANILKIGRNNSENLSSYTITIHSENTGKEYTFNNLTNTSIYKDYYYFTVDASEVQDGEYELSLNSGEIDILQVGVVYDDIEEKTTEVVYENRKKKVIEYDRDYVYPTSYFIKYKTTDGKKQTGIEDSYFGSGVTVSSQEYKNGYWYLYFNQPPTVFDDGSFSNITELVLPQSIKLLSRQNSDASNMTDINLSKVEVIYANNFLQGNEVMTAITIHSSLQEVSSNFLGSDIENRNIQKVNTTDLINWSQINWGSSSNPTKVSKNLYVNDILLTDLDLTASNIETIGQRSYEDCLTLTSVTLPSTVKEIGDYAFDGCSGLTSVNVNATTPPTIGTDALKNSTCPIYVPDSSVDEYKAASGWTQYSDRIASQYGLSPLKYKSYNGQILSRYETCMSFGEGVEITNHIAKDDGYCYVYFNQYPTKLVATHTFAFRQTYELYLPDSIKQFGDGQISVSGHGSLYYIDLNKVETINMRAFILDKDNFVLNIPDTVQSIADNFVVVGRRIQKTNITDIEKWVLIDFGGIYANPIYSSKNLYINDVLLTNLDLSHKSITKLKDLVFCWCETLTSVTLPSTVTEIGNYAFAACSGLTSITINATTPPTLGNFVFANTNDCPIYVPAASVETYKAASGWSDYADRITAIPSNNE